MIKQKPKPKLKLTKKIIKESKVRKTLLSYKKINDKLVWRKVETKLKEPKELQREIDFLKESGISVILVHGDQQLSYLAPGIDPYEVRKDMNKALVEDKEAEEATVEISASERADKKVLFSKNTKKIISV